MDSFWKEVEEYISTSVFTILIFFTCTFVRGFISIFKITYSRNVVIPYLSIRQYITTIFSVTVFRTKPAFYVLTWSRMNGLCFLLKRKVPQPRKPWAQINIFVPDKQILKCRRKCFYEIIFTLVLYSRFLSSSFYRQTLDWINTIHCVAIMKITIQHCDLVCRGSLDLYWNYCSEKNET